MVTVRHLGCDGARTFPAITLLLSPELDASPSNLPPKRPLTTALVWSGVCADSMCGEALQRARGFAQCQAWWKPETAGEGVGQHRDSLCWPGRRENSGQCKHCCLQINSSSWREHSSLFWLVLMRLPWPPHPPSPSQVSPFLAHCSPGTGAGRTAHGLCGAAPPS